MNYKMNYKLFVDTVCKKLITTINLAKNYKYIKIMYLKLYYNITEEYVY